MRATRNFLFFWLPVLLWVAVIFTASSDLMSSQRTSQVIAPALRWLIPDVSNETIQRVQFVLRKGAHVVEYAILSILLWRALAYSRNQSWRLWDWKLAGCVFAAAVVLAAADEFHQSLVPSRYGTVTDVLIDAAGAAFGLGLIWASSRPRHADRLQNAASRAG